VKYDWTVEVDGDDISQWVKAGGTIDYGKPTRFTSFQAPTAIFDVFTKDSNPNPAPAPGTWPDIRLGSVVIIHATRDGFTQSRRFSGIVQALDWGLYGLRVTATGAQVDEDGTPLPGPHLAAVDWQQLQAGWTYDPGMPLPGIPLSWPDQTETDRVQLLCGQAAAPVEIEGVPARRVRGIPQGSLAQPLLDLVLRVADDCDALLMMDRLGVMRYRTKNFARPTRVILPPHLVESTSIDLAFERGSVVNQVTVYYGEPDASTGNQMAVDVVDSTSVGEFGPRRAEMYTDIQYRAGAEGKANDYLVKNAAGWEAPDVTLLMNQATGAEADAIWELQENWRVTISPLPAGCPIGSYDGDILGFTEVMHETDYRLILHLAPPFGEENAIPEEPIFAPDSISGGTVRTYEDQYGHLWQSHTWAAAGASTLTVNEPVTVEALVVGGGGNGAAGGGSGDSGGGGGAGRLLAAELPFTPGTIAVEVGAAGGQSLLAGITCPGGGNGGASTQPGAAGGSGGGGGTGAPGGAAVEGTGHDDTRGYPGGNSPGGGQGGGGGGAAGPGAYPGGGGGIVSSVVDGTAVTYATGGRGGSNGVGAAPGATPGSGGGGGGYFFGGGGAGSPGLVSVRYRIG
jgi:hypothetical protein